MSQKRRARLFPKTSNRPALAVVKVKRRREPCRSSRLLPEEFAAANNLSKFGLCLQIGSFESPLSSGYFSYVMPLRFRHAQPELAGKLPCSPKALRLSENSWLSSPVTLLKK